ncbi:MAG: ATP synthase F1 subunit gamma [Bradymonadales bacterium]|jgi:F-type H+-transporting ATPase subunit gamma
MANLKQIRKHIASVHNTGKITKAMKMVAVSKLRKSQEAVVSTRPYVNELINVIEHLVQKTDASLHPLLREPKGERNGVLIVVSADKGLCGAYNHNIVKSARRFVAERRDQYKNFKLIFVGTKAPIALRRLEGFEREIIEDAWSKPTHSLALQLSERICEQYIEKSIDDVFVLYTRFKSAISQNVVLDGVLPLKSILKNEDDKPADDLTGVSYIYEPSVHKILDVLLPRAVSIHIQRALLEGLASENGARMTAMDNASKNAEEMIERLTLKYNRARQSAITTELIEVVSGAEAL